MTIWKTPPNVAVLNRDGRDTLGTVRSPHLGRTTRMRDIRIKNKEDKLVCVSRLTAAVIAKNQA